MIVSFILANPLCTSIPADKNINRYQHEGINNVIEHLRDSAAALSIGDKMITRLQNRKKN